MPEFNPTPEQQAILGHNPGRHARVLAGPGTGKSATLVVLVGQLLAGSPAPRIRLLTFTRAATGELAKKVSEHPTAVAERPSTIHSFAISVLLRNSGAGDLPEPLRIADGWEYEFVVRPTLARRVGVAVRTLDRLVREMAANWESLAPHQDPGVNEVVRAQFLGAWNEHRRIFGYTLLAELPYALREALQSHPELAGVEYDLLIVDEYQDLNACDLEVLRLIAARGCAVIGAGDDEQSIYSFRKAAPAGIRRFPEDYPGCADYTLSVTQRSGRRIVQWANHVIRGDPDRPPDRPVLTAADDAPEGDVALLAFPGEVSEADGVARLVRHLVDAERIPPSEILVLLRSDHQGVFSRPIRHRIERLGVPCFDPENVDRILGEPGNRRLLATLRLLVNRQDSLAWASLIELTPGLGMTFRDYLYERARAEHGRFGQALLDAYRAGFPGVVAASAKRARRLVDDVLGWLAEHASPAEEPEGGWGPWITETAGGDVAPAPSDALRQLLLALQEFIEPRLELGRYLGQIGPLGRDRAAAQAEGVRIMTMQSAKGLTVRATITAATEEGIIPRPDADLGEERRLLYVSMTRAKDFLFCTWARQRRGPTARAGQPRVATPRPYSSLLRGGPVQSEDGAAYFRRRWGQVR